MFWRDGALEGAESDAGSDLDQRDEDSNRTRHVIRNEYLADDLIRVLGEVGHPLDNTGIDRVRNAGRTNVSSHRPWTEYYDDATRDLLTERDALILRKYDYDFERLVAATAAAAPDPEG